MSANTDIIPLFLEDDGIMALPLPIRFGRRLQELRVKRGLTQTQFADMVGTGRTHISEIENGQVGSQLVTLDAFAKALGITLEQMFKGL